MAAQHGTRCLHMVAALARAAATVMFSRDAEMTLFYLALA
jgi:hypothetical protein